MPEQKPNTTTCPSCKAGYTLRPELLGKTITCPKCKKKFRTPNPVRDEIAVITGKLALFYQFITKEQFKEALSIKNSEEQSGLGTTLEEVLAKTGMISPDQMFMLHEVKDVLKAKRLKKRFGALAIGNEFITQSDVNKAVQIQKEERKKNVRKMIGDILIEIGALTETQCSSVLKQQKEIQIQLPTINQILTRQSRKKNTTVNQETTTEDVQLPGEDVKVIKANGVELTILKAGLSAFIRIVGKPEDKISLENIKHFLEENGIVYGVLKDTEIKHFLETDTMSKKGIQIATGMEPKPGKDASVQYHFDADYLTAGTINESGTIDFKDRGEIPQVNEMDLLAKKEPKISSETGVDVYGNPILIKEATDMELGVGSGAEFGEDKLSIYATTQGQPNLSIGGTISVSRDLNISGDVSYKTGHIEFDGNVNVTGSILDGFRVKAVNLSAKEILSADIETTGDIIVSDGIMGANIKAEGNIKGTFIKESRITTFGNVVVNKEILDSKLEVSGVCQVLNGAVLSSEISAKKGIISKDIGSQVCKPSVLKVGVDDQVKTALSGIKNAISKREESMKELKIMEEEFEDWQQVMHNVMAEIAHQQSRAVEEQKDFNKMMTRINKKKKSLAHGGNLSDDFKEKISAADETIDVLFKDKEEYEKKVSDLRQKHRDTQNEIKDLQREMECIIGWSKKEQGVPVVKVYGSIYAKTMISGIHSKTSLKDTYQNVSVKEVRAPQTESGSDWGMQVIR